jgi:hypothetical protein
MAVSHYHPGNVQVYVGLSTDAKPVVGLGSKFVETDTGKVWLMLNTGAWLQIGVTSTTASAVSAAVI